MFGMTPRTCWVIPAEGSKSEKSSKPPVPPGIDGFFYAETTEVTERHSVSSKRVNKRPRQRQAKNRLVGRGEVISEGKSVEALSGKYEAQARNYLRGGDKREGWG
jgi:hypothetical protein